MSGELVRYEPPNWDSWASDLSPVPSHYFNLAVRPTPNCIVTVSGLELIIARDDLTGSTLSGNKVRKLEFLLAEAKSQGYRHVVTEGGIQSNHCRATVAACRRVGLSPVIVLGTEVDPENLPIEGNIIFDRFFDAEVLTVAKGQTRSEVAQRKAEKLNAFSIPVGGSNTMGTWGYIEKWRELNTLEVDDIFVPVGSGGTAAGMIIGNFLTGQKCKLHLLQVADTVESLRTDIADIIESFSIKEKPFVVEEVMANVEMHEAIGFGYAQSTTEELEFIQSVAVETGLLFDRVYSGKALKKTLQVIKERNLKGRKCLFLHTGGIHSISDSTVTTFLSRKTQ